MDMCAGGPRGGHGSTYVDGPVAWLESLGPGWSGLEADPVPETLVWTAVGGGMCTLADILESTEPALWPRDARGLAELMGDWDAELIG